MGRYSGILLCSDFDNTLAYNRQISDENVKAIKHFQDNGGLFSIISGRTFPFLSKYSDLIKFNTYVGCINGTLIYDYPASRTVYENFLVGDIASRTLTLYRELDCICDVSVFDRSGDTAIKADDACFEDKLLKYLSVSAYKLLIHSREPYTDEQIAYVKGVLGDSYTVARSWDRGIEVQNADCDKGTAARRMATLADAELLVCAGDYENDISMIKEADIGYAVANALESVKLAADRLTTDVRDHAIARIIEEL